MVKRNSSKKVLSVALAFIMVIFLCSIFLAMTACVATGTANDGFEWDDQGGTTITITGVSNKHSFSDGLLRLIPSRINEVLAMKMDCVKPYNGNC